MNVNLNELKRLAGNCSTKRWYWDTLRAGAVVVDAEGTTVAVNVNGCQNELMLIGSLSPDYVLEMIAEIESLRAQLAVK